MITRRTRVQLIFFVIITLLGVSYVGARYAKLNRYFVDDSYTVVAHLSDSGGIFAGAGVAYRGVGIGQVDRLKLTDAGGVDVYMNIENSYDQIPSDTEAVVGNRSAVGEQYIDLQPKTDDAPYLEAGSQIAEDDTQLPIPTNQLLGNLAKTTGSIDLPALRTTVDELGQAFGGTGEDLQRIIDTGNDFIDAADANFGTTTALIKDSNTVLNTQIDSEQSLRTFASQLSLFSGTLADADPDLRRLIDTGSTAAIQLRTFIQQNRIDLGELISRLNTTGKIVVKHLDGIRQVLVVYPYVVQGGFTVASRDPDTGLIDAHFGLITTDHALCHEGYGSTDTRTPESRGNRPMNKKARCAEPATMSNARGAQNAPGSDNRPVATYDEGTGKVTWGAVDPRLTTIDTLAPASLGGDSWKWLFLQPLTAGGQ